MFSRLQIKKKPTFTECLLISVDLYAYSLYLYLFLPQLSCPFSRLSSPVGSDRVHRVRGESSYLCLSLQSWGAAEWDQCKAGLTSYAVWLTTRSKETLLPFTPLTCLHFFRLKEHLKYFNQLKSCSAPRAGASPLLPVQEQVKQETRGSSGTVEEFFRHFFRDLLGFNDLT